jgi:hypothetical protein
MRVVVIKNRDNWGDGQYPTASKCLSSIRSITSHFGW